MTIQIEEKQLKKLIKQSVKEALDIELMKLRALVIPAISEDEQKDVEQHFGKPSRKTAKSYTVSI